MQSANSSNAKVPVGTFVEFQVIVLTNDENHFASDLCEGTCKGLIKISNRPMIYYILRNLIEQKLKYITIVVNSKYYDEMVSYVNETFPENHKVDDKKSMAGYFIDVEPYTSNNNEELGPIQCLLHIRHRIKSDFIVVNCDIVGFVDFHSLANLFRGENAICALLLLEENQTDNENKKQKREDELLNLENNIWVCIDKNSKVVSIKDSLSMKQSGRLKISKINLTAHRNFILKTDLLDSHVYIFKNYVLDIMDHKTNFTSIKYDLIPYLIKIQNTRRAAEYYSKSEFKFNMYKTLINKYEGGEDNDVSEQKEGAIAPHGTLDQKENIESVVCYVQPKSNGFCQRINSLPNFIKANMLFCVSRHEQLKNVLPPYCFFLMSDKNQSYKDCIISSQFEHEENVILKKSVLGKNVRIKKNSSVNRSIFMDNIIISENCHIQNSIICKNVVIEDNCKLVDCIVRENSVIERNGIFEKETLPLFIS
ncbi:translation initiation factor eIF-2B subunit gamma, putative [Plasmodium knowlesi strain H]|uniref:Translation initiation factor eIF2B subunit gamma n=2 Tax=Plasmodium knowlesi TaxID=5850 RepID=A0A679L115_PLAKH|nr:translation initiation factor eIF-2B subunit gamma, putative [Plasmodium knowlesi strain H]OTN65390.1 putative Translation initiation factor EIF-2B gamma subunit [Plasmodium knowlesi]CAA9989348.1 translation initiation factor eIF-2B subunit gamma, putative [Plasmodium knowlesi strain H]VVS78822.1 translation initiation factor eIF-2B subunit gamma, putative [Plasmodium knowlesi strain H]